MPAPIEFDKLLEFVDDRDLLQVVHGLLEKKKSNEELAKAPSIPVLNKFIESELNRLEILDLTKPVISVK